MSLTLAKRQKLLINAAETGNLEEVTRLVERQGTNVNCTDEKRLASPLMFAAANSQVSVCKYLLSKRASLQVKDAVGWNALNWACYGCGTGRGWVHEKSFETIKLLAEASDEALESTTLSGFTPLMTFLKHFSNVITEISFPKGHRNKRKLLETQLEVIPLLLPNDAKASYKLVHVQKNNFGETAIHLCNGKYGKYLRQKVESSVTWKLPKSTNIESDPYFADALSTFKDEEYKERKEDVEDTSIACYDRKTGYAVLETS